MMKEKIQKLKINNIEINNNYQKIDNKQNILFYRKSSSKNNKTSFYHHKKDSAPLNILAQNQNNYKFISSLKKKNYIYNYSNEEATPSTKKKTINHSKNKSSDKISIEDITLDKQILNKTSISPFSLKGHNSFKENIFNEKLLDKICQTSKNISTNSNCILNYEIKKKNLQFNSFNKRNKSYVKYENNQKKFLLINNNQNNNSFLNYKTKENKVLKNLEKNEINLTFKENNDKESIDLLNEDIMVKLHKHSLNKSKNNNINNYKNINPYIIKNNIKINRNDYIKSDFRNNYKYTTSFNNDKSIINYNNKNINNNTIEAKSRIYKYKKSKNLSNNINTNDISNINLSKGKIIKFNYNGNEFFFHPNYNKTHNSFYKSSRRLINKNENIIKSAKIIQKWWKKTIYIKILIFKNKIKFFNNTIKNILIKNNFKTLKYRTIFINKIIYIQRKWRQFLSSKKEHITSFYIKKETYGSDNSNIKNDIDNFFINTSEFINTTEENNNYKFINNKIVFNKNNILLNNTKSRGLYKKKLFESNKQEYNNAFINNKKKIKINNSCFTKINYRNIIDKIIFIQKKIKKFLRRMFSYNLRTLYKNLFSDLIVNNKFNLLNISEIKDNNFSIYSNDNIYNKINKKQIDLKEYEISNNINFYIFDNCNKKSKKQLFNITKNKDIFFERYIPKNNYNLNIQKEHNINISFKPIIKPLQFSYEYLTLIPKKCIKKFDVYKMSISNTKNIFIKTKKNNIFNIDKNKIQFSIQKEINEKNLNFQKNINNNKIEIIKLPLVKEFCFLEKTKINKKYINNIINLQTYYRNNIIKIENNLQKRVILTSNNIITKIYKDNSLNFSNIVKIQRIYKHHLKSKKYIFFKPKTLNMYISKKYIIKNVINDFEKLKKNISKNVKLKEESNNKSAKYFNNINDEFFSEKENEEKNINDITKYNTINTHRKISKERIITYISDTEERKNKKSLKKVNTKRHKNCNSQNLDFLSNIRSNNRFININSLPSVKSWKINSKNNETSNEDSSLIYTNNNKHRIYICQNNISIQTLESKESRNELKENINLNPSKRITTDENKFKINTIRTEIDNDKNYFYTDNDIARFSFSNGDTFFLNNSISRTNTKNILKVGKFINNYKIKIFCSKLRRLIYNINLYIFIYILIKKIQKNINKIVFCKISKRKNNTNFYSIIKRHIEIYNKIIEDKNNELNYFSKNELIKLIENNIYHKYLQYKLNDKFLFLTNEQEKNFIETDLFVNNDKDLIDYYFLYYKIENKLLDDNYFNLIQFRLIKEPLLNLNIFSITRYMDELYYNIVHDNICKKCFCKINENCSINCNCHVKLNNSINLINKIKNKINHNKSFNIDSAKNEGSYDLLDINNQKEKGCIRIVIKKVKRSSADNSRIRTNNIEENNDIFSSNDIDIFQKMNTGIKSLINKVKINKAFKDFNQNKKNRQIKYSLTKIGRTYTEFGETNYLNKKENISYIEKTKYNTIFCGNKNDDDIPEKKEYSFLCKGKLFQDK